MFIIITSAILSCCVHVFGGFCWEQSSSVDWSPQTGTPRPAAQLQWVSGPRLISLTIDRLRPMVSWFRGSSEPAYCIVWGCWAESHTSEFSGE